MPSRPAKRLPRMMIGFVVRRCVVELGRCPTPAEFAAWANNPGKEGPRLFGRPISETEARLILRHQARLVSAKSATGKEVYDEEAGASWSVTPSDNVINFAAARARLAARRR